MKRPDLIVNQSPLSATSPPRHRRGGEVEAWSLVFGLVACWSILFCGSTWAGAEPAGASRAVAATATSDVPAVDDGTDSIVENPQQVGVPSGQVSDDDRAVYAVIAGLVFVALALTALTVRYWRVTRPEPRAVPVTSGAPSRSSRSARSRRSGSSGRRARSKAEPPQSVAARGDDGDDGDDIFVTE